MISNALYSEAFLCVRIYAAVAPAGRLGQAGLFPLLGAGALGGKDI